MNKIPLQIYINRNLYEQLKSVARRKKVSQSELARNYLRQGLEKDLAPEDPALEIVGLGEGKTPDLAEKHDHYLFLREKEHWK